MLQQDIIDILEVSWIILDEATDLRQFHIILPLLPVNVNNFNPVLKHRISFVEFALFLNLLGALQWFLLQLLRQSLTQFDGDFFAVLIQYDDRGVLLWREVCSTDFETVIHATEFVD